MIGLVSSPYTVVRRCRQVFWISVLVIRYQTLVKRDKKVTVQVGGTETNFKTFFMTGSRPRRRRFLAPIVAPTHRKLTSDGQPFISVSFS